MSRKFGYFCLDCGVSSYPWFNHGGDLLSRLAHDWPAIKAARQTTSYQQGDLHIAPDTSLGYIEGEEGPFEFLTTHDGHRIAIADEYHRLESLAPQEPWQVGAIYYVTLNDGQLAQLRAALNLDRDPHPHEIYAAFQPYMGAFVPALVLQRLVRDREEGLGPDLAV